MSEINAERPPRWSLFSNTNTLQPTSAAVHAASSPAVPPPTTTTLQFLSTFNFLYTSPSGTAGFTVQRIGRLTPIRLPAQPTLQEIHLRRISSSPSATLFTQFGSAISPRPIPTISTSPLSSTFSTTFGSR